jgi:glycosyltransferase involved in cell wall biosynthesis
LTVLFICTREREYVRNEVILACLGRKYSVREITSSSRFYPVRIAEVALRFIFSRVKHDAVFAGFLAQPLMPLLRLFSRKPVVFDAFISLYDTLCFDRKIFRANSLIGRFCRWLDQRSCDWAGAVTTDTLAHAAYFSETFNIPRDKFHRVYVGANEHAFRPAPAVLPDRGEFTVFYYGTYLPLHGIDYIIRAAKLLEGRKDIRFEVVGRGGEKEKILGLARSLGLANVTFTDWIPYAELPAAISGADICLGGHFSGVEKAGRVISGKTFQFIAMGKPTIVGDCKASRELFTHGENACLCKMANAEALAEAVSSLCGDRDLREKIGRGGLELFLRECAPAKLASDLESAVLAACAKEVR